MIVIGTGIRSTVGQLTVDAISWMEVADRVLYVIGDPIAKATIHRLNPNWAESMADDYEEGQPRINACNRMIERILQCVRAGEKTVVYTPGFLPPTAKDQRESVAVKLYCSLTSLPLDNLEYLL